MSVRFERAIPGGRFEDSEILMAVLTDSFLMSPCPAFHHLIAHLALRGLTADKSFNLLTDSQQG